MASWMNEGWGDYTDDPSGDRYRRDSRGDGAPGFGSQTFGFGGSRSGGGIPPWVTDLVRSFGGPNLGAQPPRGPKVRRGDVRSAILAVLFDHGPMNGYQVITAIAERTDNAWKPSPGSVYPTIQQLEDEGLLVAVDADGRRALELTDAGRDYVSSREDEIASTWRPFENPEPVRPLGGIGNLKPAASQFMGALWQVMSTGTDQQRAEAIEIVNDARKKLYGLLAQDETQDDV